MRSVLCVDVGGTRIKAAVFPELIELNSLTTRLSKSNSYSFLILVILRDHAKQKHGSGDTDEVP